jgi:ESS family glutamate:Na+ symporter
MLWEPGGWAEASFGAAPLAFLVIPLVGLFFIDFANALIVTGFVTWVK